MEANTQNLIDKVQEWQVKNNTLLANEMDRIVNNHRYKADKLIELKALISIFAEALQKEGLRLENLSHSKGGGHGDNWTKETKLVVSFNGIPINGKFRFLTELHGDSNAKKRIEKKTKLADSFLTVTGLRPHINEFSLVQRKPADNKAVMYQVSI